MAELTNKNLDFLSNQELIRIVKSALDELDNVASSGAHRSTTYLAVSMIEGLFDELFKLLDVHHSDFPKVWPEQNGRPKKVKDLTLANKEEILKAAKALPDDFESFYERVRKYRNYMHPSAELKDLKPIRRSSAQLALAALNALIEKYEAQRFVASQIWKLHYGIARVPDSLTIHMPQNPGDPVSLLISQLSADKFKEITCRVLIKPGAIFNFVYNYKSLDQFMAARIEGRIHEGRGADNGRLICNKWRVWSINGRYTRETEPTPSLQEHDLRFVSEPPGGLNLIIDGTPLALESGASFDFDPEKQVGFLTEQGAVSITNLAISV